jgi:hypothetical protein
MRADNETQVNGESNAQRRRAVFDTNVIEGRYLAPLLPPTTSGATFMLTRRRALSLSASRRRSATGRWPCSRTCTATCGIFFSSNAEAH